MFVHSISGRFIAKSSLLHNFKFMSALSNICPVVPDLKETMLLKLFKNKIVSSS